MSENHPHIHLTFATTMLEDLEHFSSRKKKKLMRHTFGSGAPCVVPGCTEPRKVPGPDDKRKTVYPRCPKHFSEHKITLRKLYTKNQKQKRRDAKETRV